MNKKALSLAVRPWLYCSFLLLSASFLEFAQADTFVRHGNIGAVSCDTYCASPKWRGRPDGNGRIGSCVSAFNSKTNTSVSCGSVPGNLNAELTCTCKEDATLKTGNNGTISCDGFCARYGRTCHAAYNTDANNMPTCGTAPGQIANGQLECSCNKELNLPLTQGTEKVVGSHRHVKSSVTLSKNGIVTANTRVWTDELFQGFHGGGVVYFKDSEDATIGMVAIPTIGVNGKNIPGLPSDRTVPWNRQISATTALQTHSIVIEQYENPEPQLGNRIDDVIVLVKKLCPTSIEVDRTAAGGKVICK